MIVKTLLHHIFLNQKNLEGKVKIIHTTVPLSGNMSSSTTSFISFRVSLTFLRALDPSDIA